MQVRCNDVFFSHLSLLSDIHPEPGSRKLCNSFECPVRSAPSNMRLQTPPNAYLHGLQKKTRIAGSTCTITAHKISSLVFLRPHQSFFLYRAAHDHFISPLGCLVLRFEFNWGAVPPGTCCVTEVLVWSRNRNPAVSLRLGANSSLGDIVAREDLELRGIEGLGTLLFVNNDELPGISALVRLIICGCAPGPSLLLGRYSTEESLPFEPEGAASRLGVTLPSMNADDCEMPRA